MSFGSIQFGGLASGLDTSAIISAILQLERRPMVALEDQKGTEENKLSLLSTFENLVRDLRTRSQELAAGNTIFATKLTVANEAVATITASGSAAPGSHSLDVLFLAQADRYSFDGIADPDTALGGGTISFDINQRDTDGNLVLQSYSIDITAGTNDTLDGIAAQINSVAGDDVTANVVNAGTESSPSYQLVIASNRTGEDYSIQNLSVAGVGLTGQDNVTPATNAQVLIDGLTVERSTNVFTDVLPGVTFTVTEQGSTNFSIETDPDGVKENIQGFVDAYNAVIGFINDQNEIDIEAENVETGDLFGDNSLQSVRTALNLALNARVPTPGTPEFTAFQSDGYATLGLVGIDLQADGTLKIDDALLTEKLTNDLNAFVDLFTEDVAASNPTTDGVLIHIDEALENILDDRTALDASGNPILDAQGQEIQVTGIFNSRRDAINSIIRSLDDQIERIEYHVEQREIALVQQFTRLEELLGQLSSQQAFLAGGLNLPGI